MGRRTYFVIWISAILLVDCASAGLLQSIRDAAMLKDAIISQSGRDSRDISLLKAFDMPQSNLVKTELSFFEKLVDKSCPPGDFVCLAQKSFKNNVHNEVSNAVVKSVATVMTDMLNSTISRSLKDMMASANSPNDPEKAAEARQAMTMVTGALQTVSSKVIQAFAYFIKVSMSGVMWDLFHQMVRAARSSEAAAVSSPNTGRAPSPSVLGNHGGNYYEYKTEDALNTLSSNNIKRAVMSS